MSKKTTIYILPSLAILLISCGTFGVGPETLLPSELPPPSFTTQPTETPLPPSPTVGPAASPTPEPSPNSSQYWTIYQDPVLGFQFALPCYWRLEFPEVAQYSTGSGITYQAYNFTEDYPRSFPRSIIPDEYGWTKVDFGVINVEFYGVSPGSSLEEFVIAENTGGEGEIQEIVDTQVGEQPAVIATIYYADRDITGRYYLIQVSEDVFLRFSTAPTPDRLDSEDLIGILNSITFDPEAEVNLPPQLPAAPPLGLAARCIPEYAEAVIPTVEIPPENTACGLDSFKSLEALTEKVQQFLQDRNTGGLRWDYLIHDPIVIGYWGSEGAIRTPDEFASELANSLYAPGKPGGMTFTTDRSQFPPLAGTPPERLFDPAINFVEIIYSEGWGQEQQGAALLYFAEDECGGYYWYGLAYSNTHFDR